MHPLVAIEEAENLSAQPERHGLGGPREAHSRAAHALRSEDHRLFERAERHGHLKDDPPILELAPGCKVRPPAVTQRLDHHLVLSSTRQPLQDAPGFGICQPGQLTAYDHDEKYAGDTGPGRLAPGLGEQANASSSAS